MNSSRPRILTIILLSAIALSLSLSQSASASPNVCLIPEIPVLLSPPDFSGTNDTTPAFDWEDAANASIYQIQVDDYIGFLSPSIDASPAVSTYTPAAPLSDSNYFWRVRGINNTAGCNETGPWSDNSYLVITTASPFDITSNWAAYPPNTNGRILAGEWTDAAVYTITSPGPLVSAQSVFEEMSTLPGGFTVPDPVSHTQAPQSPAAPDYFPVTLYIKNSGTVLYMAVDNPNDTTISPVDQLGVYFDDNPLPSDGQWTLPACGNTDGEGRFLILAPYINFREFISGAVQCLDVTSPPGVGGALSYATGHLQVEASFNLQTSALRGAPGDVINMYFWIYDYDSKVFHGRWPLTANFQDPSSFGSVTLAVSDGSVNVYFPLVIR